MRPSGDFFVCPLPLTSPFFYLLRRAIRVFTVFSFLIRKCAQEKWARSFCMWMWFMQTMHIDMAPNRLSRERERERERERAKETTTNKTWRGRETEHWDKRTKKPFWLDDCCLIDWLTDWLTDRQSIARVESWQEEEKNWRRRNGKRKKNRPERSVC